MLLTKNALLPKLHAQSNKHVLKINLCKITMYMPINGTFINEYSKFINSLHIFGT